MLHKAHEKSTLFTNVIIILFYAILFLKLFWFIFSKGVPLQPKWIKVIEKQCGKFEVTWSPDTLDSGGGPPSAFQVQISDQTGQWVNCTNFLPNNSCLFKDLQSETEYDIQVRAINQKGPGEWKVDTKKTGFIGKWTHLRKPKCGAPVKYS